MPVRNAARRRYPRVCLFGVHRLFEISMPVFNEYARVLLALHFVNTVACGEERGGGGGVWYGT